MKGNKKYKKIKYILLISIMVIFLVPIVLLINVRAEFKNYLKETHSDKSFSIGFVMFDPIYMKFVTRATCLEDYTEFPISKSLNTKKISENYLQQRSQNAYNSTLKNMFVNSDFEEYIRNITGSGKMNLYENKSYDQINIYLSENANHSAVIKSSLLLLEKNKVTCSNIIFEYEKDKSVYRFNINSDNIEITENEIEHQIVKIKAF